MNNMKHTIMMKAVLAAITMSITAISAFAQTVTYEIDLVLTTAPNTVDYGVGDHFNGGFTVDLSMLTNSGDEYLSIGEGVESAHFVFIGGERYSHLDDISNGFPRAYFTDGEVVGFDLWNSLGLRNGVDGTFFRFFRDKSFQYSPDGSSEYTGIYDISLAPASVPEPSSSLLLVLSAGSFMVRRKRSVL